MDDARLAVETGVGGVKSKGLEIRFSSKTRSIPTSFPSTATSTKSCVHRVGIADTVGCVMPRQVCHLARMLVSW